MQLSLRSWLVLVVLVVLGCSLAACGDDDGGVVDGGPLDGGAPDSGALDASTVDAGSGDAGAIDGGAPTRLDGFLEEVATAQCTALFRCCDEASIEEFFSQYRSIPGLPSPFDALQARIPPDATLDMASCTALMIDLHAIAPFGGWLAAADVGRVTLDEAALDACLGELEDATCGAELSDALYDTTCFGYLGRQEPGGPRTTARAYFERSSAVGATCAPVEDSGSDAYGTCDPDVAFCCQSEPGSTDCTGGEGEGTCVATAALGETCSEFPYLLCAPGLVCRAGSSIEEPSTCVEPDTTPLANGDPCRGASFEPLGVCTDGFCNVENVCEVRRADDAPCDEARMCESGNCAGPFDARACAPFAFCTSGE